MKTNLCVSLLCLFSFFEINAQTEKCNLEKSNYSELHTVDVEQTICLAQNSDKDITVFYTFADWCSPCKKTFPEAIKLSEEYNVDFYVLLVDKEGDDFYNNRAISTINSYNKQLKAVIISDSLYSAKNLKYVNKKRLIEIRATRHREKYDNYVTQITPPEFENSADMSKFIVINKKGEVLLVTNYNDYKNAEGKDDDSVCFQKVIKAIEMDRMTSNKSNNSKNKN